MRRPDRWSWMFEADPVAGLVNLFDIWLVFAVALTVALMSRHASTKAHEAVSADKSGADARIEFEKIVREVPHYRPSDTPMTGDGTRLGVAYRLANGEIVYVPDTSPTGH